MRRKKGKYSLESIDMWRRLHIYVCVATRKQNRLEYSRCSQQSNPETHLVKGKVWI